MRQEIKNYHLLSERCMSFISTDGLSKLVSCQKINILIIMKSLRILLLDYIVTIIPVTLVNSARAYVYISVAALFGDSCRNVNPNLKNMSKTNL